MATNASTEEFHFSGPAEELDFTEPADFQFPSGQPAEPSLSFEQSGEFPPVAGTAYSQSAEGETLFGAAEQFSAETPHAEAEAAEEGIADLEAAEELPEGMEEGEEEAKPKFELPRWLQITEWVTVGVLAVGALLAIVISVFWVQEPKHVTLALNIACPVMLGLIPYALWRSMARWVTPEASAVYTVILALSAAALIAGTWFVGGELANYDWQYTKARVAVGAPRPVAMPMTPTAAAMQREPAAAPPVADAKSTAK